MKMEVREKYSQWQRLYESPLLSDKKPIALSSATYSGCSLMKSGEEVVQRGTSEASGNKLTFHGAP